MSDSNDKRLAEHAASHHGVISVRELAGIGLDAHAVRLRVRAGRLHRVHRGVYAVGYPRLTQHGRWRAAVLSCGPGAVLSHGSAAALWGLLRATGKLSVTVPATSGVRSRRDLRLHRSMHADSIVVDAIPVTPLALTLVDVAAVVPRGVLESAVRQAEILELLDMRAIEAVVARAPRRAGIAALRRALGIELRPRERSRLERRFIAACRARGLPVPDCKVQVCGQEVDFSWPDARLVVEIDGGAFHGGRVAVHRDKRRDTLLTISGWHVLRFSDWQVDEELPKVLRAVGAALDRGAAAA